MGTGQDRTCPRREPTVTVCRRTVPAMVWGMQGDRTEVSVVVWVEAEVVVWAEAEVGGNGKVESTTEVRDERRCLQCQEVMELDRVDSVR